MKRYITRALLAFAAVTAFLLGGAAISVPVAEAQSVNAQCSIGNLYPCFTTLLQGSFTYSGGNTFSGSNTHSGTSLFSGTFQIGASDFGSRRVAAGVGAPSNGAAGNGWWQQVSGRSTLAADYSNATAAFTNTLLSVTVTSGRKYNFNAALFLVDSTAADGAQIDFNGGTAAATDFRVHCNHFDQTAAVLKSTQVTALATVADSVVSTGTGQNLVECYGSFQPSGTGTFIVRAAQVAHTAGTLTVNRGSFVFVEDMP